MFEEYVLSHSLAYVDIFFSWLLGGVFHPQKFLGVVFLHSKEDPTGFETYPESMFLHIV